MAKQREILAASLKWDTHAGVTEAYDGPLYVATTYALPLQHRHSAEAIASRQSSYYGYMFHAGPPRMAYYFKDPESPDLFIAALRIEQPSSVPLQDGPIAQAAVECSYEPPPIRVTHQATTTPSRPPTRRKDNMTTRPNSKGFLVLEAFSNAGKAGITRVAAAEAAGCTVQRVGEILRNNAELVTSVEGETKGLYTITAADWKAFIKAREAADKEKAAAAEAKEAEKAAAKEAKAAEKAAAKAAAAEATADPTDA